MLSSRWCILLCIAALACTPKLNGTCATSSDCLTGESCSSAGLCLRPGAVSGNGDGGDPSAGGDAGNGSDAGAGSDAGGLSDAGDAGPIDTSASIDILSPAASAIERGTFHVAAQAASAIAIQDVTFYLTNSSTGIGLGQLAVTTPVAKTWSGDITLNASSFGGNADLVAVVHRTGLTDVTSAKVLVIIDQNAPSIAASWNAALWSPLDAGLSLTATVSDDRSGVASATLILPDGGTIPGTLASGVATFKLPASAVGSPGAAVKVPVSLAASDFAGNQTLVNNASLIRVDAQPPSIALVALDPTVWRNGPLDVNANLSDGAGSGLASASLLLNGAFTAGTPDGGGGYDYHVDLSTLPATEAAVALQVIGVDNVGNQADAGFNINVDNVAPVVSSPGIDTGPDVTDLNGKGWFRGPTVAPGGANIVVSAVVRDTNLSSSPAPSALVGAKSYPGNLAAGRWHFSIPRSVGLNAAGAVTITFDAQDAAGNHPVSPPALNVNFDDKNTFAIAIASDSVVRGPSQTATISLQTAPPSGFPLKSGVVDLAAAAKLSLGSCTGASAVAADATSTIVASPGNSTLVFNVPIGSCAPGNTDGAVPFSIAVNSLVGGAGSGTGNTSVDTRGPVIGNLSITYPPADGGPLGWSHDANHFNRRDSGQLLSFSAYDCHGLSAASAGVSGLGTGVTITQATDSSGVLNPAGTCASPSGVTVQQFTVTANLATVPTASLPAEDNILGWTAMISDSFGNQSSLPSTINVTRRFWKAAPPTVISSLSLGPKLFGSALGSTMYAFDPANGSSGSWGVSSDAAVIAPNAGTPAVIYTSGGAVYAGDASSAKTATFGSCAHGDTLTGASLVDASTAFYSSQSDTFTCIRGCADCGAGVPCSSCPSCQIVTTHFYTDLLHLSGSTVSCPAGTGSSGTDCNGSSSGNAAYSNRIYSGNPSNYIGLNANTWYMINPSGVAVAATGNNVVTAPGWPLIDGSNPPLVYLPGLGTAGNVELRVMNASSFGPAPFALPQFPGSITDMLLAKNGILYVLSNNTIHAALTDSVGAGTAAGGNQTSGWPSQCRDPCRTSTAGIQCPY